MTATKPVATRTYKMSEVLKMSREQRGDLYKRLREDRGLEPQEILMMIGRENNGRSQVALWERHGTITENKTDLRKYYQALGIKIDM